MGIFPLNSLRLPLASASMVRQGILGCGQHLRGVAVLSFSSTELPITFKTVSEFRRARSVRANNSVAAEPVTCHPPQIPGNPESIGGSPNSGIKIDAALPTLDFEQSALPLPSQLPPVTPRAASIQQALHYFDSEAGITVPTSFSPEAADAAGDSALNQFTSNAVDIESTFRFGSGNSIQKDALSLPINIKNELLEDDGACLPVSDLAACEAEEVPLPGEPTLASLRMVDQASVLKDPQENSSITTAVETDESGRVVRALYYGGEAVRFQYDAYGELIEFNYAGMQWIKDDYVWAARDRQTEYFVEGRISVMPGGAIRIEREDVVRILKLSGTRVDEHKTGSRTESRKLKNKPSPYDLLAKAKAENSIWLSAKPGPKTTADSSSSFRLDLMPLPESGPSMIPDLAKAACNPAVAHPSNLTCVPSTPIELRSLERTEKLRSLEDELLEPEREKNAQSKIKFKISECFLKSSLWVKDRIVGQSSPKHLEELDRLANLYFEQQRNDLAELTHLRALHIREQFYGKKQPELAVSLRGLASIYEARGNYLRAEEMQKEAIEMQENGLRKMLFLYSEKVIDSGKLSQQLDDLFASVAELANLYALTGKQKICNVVYEKAVALTSDICEREPTVEHILHQVVQPHIDAMRELCIY